jgi:hypothetical protein
VLSNPVWSATREDGNPVQTGTGVFNAFMGVQIVQDEPDGALIIRAAVGDVYRETRVNLVTPNP